MPVVKSDNMTGQIRQINDSDYDEVIKNLNNWWGGRDMTDMLPRLFFKFFGSTGFIIKNDEDVVGFLVGFIAQNNPQKGYVHFIGVNPDYRKKNVGKRLYNHFFDVMIQKGVSSVECVTSPANKNSIAFHQSIGFKIKAGNRLTEEGISYFYNYDGAGEDRVVFSKELGATLQLN